MAGGDGGGRPGEDACGLCGAGSVGDICVFQDIFDVFDDDIRASGAANVFGGEAILDEVAGVGGFGGGVDVLSEIGGGFGLGVTCGR